MEFLQAIGIIWIIITFSSIITGIIMIISFNEDNPGELMANYKCLKYLKPWANKVRRFAFFMFNIFIGYPSFIGEYLGIKLRKLAMNTDDSSCD